VTPYPQTTPHEREILKHYFMHAGTGADHQPWKGGGENWVQLDHQVIAKFVAAGLLESTTVLERSGRPKIVANREALAVYFHALDCVPLPVQVWKIPEFQA
jgi:hypothetical protein